jgi:uncharacterized membrane protein
LWSSAVAIAVPSRQTVPWPALIKILNRISGTLLLIATVVLMALSAILIGYAGWAIARPFWAGEDLTRAIVEAVSVIIIAFAVMALSKFILEEEIERDRELASAREARRSLTKMVTIIIIALNLEALVMVFEANRGDVATAIYPIGLFAVAVMALVGLGAYQWLSNAVEQDNDNEAREEKQRRKG